MRGVVKILILSLLLALALAAKSSVSTVEASPAVHQGDLVLGGNNVTVIEGRFDINGSIVVEGNASLFLRDAFLNFTQDEPRQHNLTLRTPLNGNPRLTAANSTITSRIYLIIRLYDNSTAVFSNSEIIHQLYAFENSTVSISDGSDIGALLGCRDYSSVKVSDSSVNYMETDGRCEAYVHNSVLYHYLQTVSSLNCTVSNLEPGYVSYWSLASNHTVTVIPQSQMPNATIMDTEISNWHLSFSSQSNVTVTDSTIYRVHSYGSSIVSIASLRGHVANAGGLSKLFINDSSLYEVRTWGESVSRLLNTTFVYADAGHSAKIFVSWYLNMSVVDSLDQPVPGANVVASFPNASAAASQLTDSHGLAELVLLEKMVNDTGEYPVGNYSVEASYLAYSDGTTVNMTGNQLVALQLEDFIIPEFPPFLLLLILVVGSSFAALRKVKVQ